MSTDRGAYRENAGGGAAEMQERVAALESELARLRDTRRLTALGRFALPALWGIAAVIVSSVAVLVLANDYSGLSAVGAGGITFAVCGAIATGITCAGWDAFTEKK